MRSKKLITVLALSLIALIWVSSGTGLWAQAKKVYINGFDGNYPPFTYIDKKGNPAGADIEAVKWIAKEMGFEVKFKAVAWDAIIPTLQARKIDFISTMTPTEERKKVVDFSTPYWETGLAVVVREDSDLNIVSALNGKGIVGVDRGAASETWINNNLVKTGILPKNKLKLYDNAILAIKDVINRRIGASVNDELMVKEATKGKPLKIVGVINTGSTNNFAVRKGDKNLKQLLDEGVKRLLESPEWAKIVATYLK